MSVVGWALSVAGSAVVAVVSVTGSAHGVTVGHVGGCIEWVTAVVSDAPVVSFPSSTAAPSSMSPGCSSLSSSVVTVGVARIDSVCAVCVEVV